MRFTEADIGCYIDGGLGTDHALLRCAALVHDLNPALHDSLVHLYEELAGPEPDAYIGEAIDEAFEDTTRTLQTHTVDGLMWSWECGDLLLLSDAEPDPWTQPDHTDDPRPEQWGRVF